MRHAALFAAFAACCLGSADPLSAQSCGEVGGDYCSESGSCPAGYNSLGQTDDCSPCCVSAPPPDPGPSCGALGGDYCSQSGSCPGGHNSLGHTYDCSPCCLSAPPPDPGPSCGQLGGNYCSQSGSCPAGHNSLGQTYDCSPCCLAPPPPDPGPSCGQLGGDHCSQSGSCPAGHDTLGQTYDCNPCCRAQPSPPPGDVGLEIEVGGPSVTASSSGGEGGGDLFLTVACVANVEYYSPGGSTYVLWITMNIDGEVEEEEFHGLGGGIHRLEMTVPAKPYDREVYCNLRTSFDVSASVAGTLLNSGPGVVRITVGAFIPYEWIWGPLGILADRIYEGDDRDFREDPGSSRVASVIEVANPAYLSSSAASSHRYTGPSVEYEMSTSISEVSYRLTGSARNDWIWDPPLKTRWATASNDRIGCVADRLGPDPENAVTRLRVVCEGAADMPLAPSPDIDYKFDFELTFGQGKLAYKLTGCHDGYPAYEAYLGGKSVYAQLPIAATPWALFGSCTHPISETGEVP